MASIYSTILEQCLLKICPTKESLLAIPESYSKYSKYAEVAIRRELDAKRIVTFEETKYDDRTRKVRTQTYCKITVAGIRYLAEMAKGDEKGKDRSDSPWVKYLSIPAGKRVQLVADISTDRDRISLISEAALLSEIAGAKVPLLLFDEYDPCTGITQDEISMSTVLAAAEVIGSAHYSKENLDEQRRQKQSLRALTRSGEIITNQSLVHDAAVKCADAEAKLIESLIGEEQDPTEFFPDKEDIQDEKYFRFIKANTVKAVSLMNAMESIADKHDTDRGMFIGLLQSKKRSLLLYNTHAPIFRWYTFGAKREAVALRIWKDRLTPLFKENLDPSDEAAVFISGYKAFREIFNAKENFTGQGEDRTCRIGPDFQSFYIIPVSHPGAQMLHDIMLTDKAEFMKSTTAGVRAATEYEENDGAYKDDLPLRKGNDYLAIGYWMDLKQIMRLRKIRLMSPELNITLLCDQWQKEMYQYALDVTVSTWDELLEKEA